MKKSRVSCESSKHLHIFLAKWHLTEQHLFMPMIHWLPKNVFRFIVIYFWVAIGKEPYWDSLKVERLRERSKVYYSYSISQTFYRSERQLSRAYKDAGFVTDFQYKYRKRWRQLFRLLPHTIIVHASRWFVITNHFSVFDFEKWIVWRKWIA